MLENLKKLFFVSRPISWVNTAYPFIAAYLLLGGVVDPLLIIGGLFFLIPYNLLMYGINDVFDYESDMKNPRKGSIEGAKEARSFHPVIMVSAIGSAVVGSGVLLIFLTWPARFVLLSVLFFVVAYSVKGLRFKEKPVLDSIASSLHFVGPALVAAAFFNFPANALPFLVAFFLWGMASHAFGAVQDVIPDRKGRIASIATIFGARWTVRLSVILYAAATIILIVQDAGLIAIALCGIAYIVNILSFWNISDKNSGQSNTGWKRFIWLNYVTGAIVTLTLLSILLA